MYDCHAVVIYGPPGCGKSTHREALARYYRKTEVLDGWDGLGALGSNVLALITANSKSNNILQPSSQQQRPGWENYCWLSFEDACASACIDTGRPPFPVPPPPEDKITRCPTCDGKRYRQTVKKLVCPGCSKKIPVSPLPSPLEAFDKASTITIERGAIYGHPADDFRNVAMGANVILKCKDPLLRHALYMIWVKICRLVESPDHLDSWIDIAGYARTGVMVLDREEGDE